MLRLTACLHPGVVRALTGLRAEEFARLLPAFTQAYTAARQQAWAKRVRRRQPGGGCTGHLPTPETKLLFILVYVRHYPLQHLQGLLFGISQPQACAWIHTLLPVLEAALGQVVTLPARPTATLADLQARCPDLQLLLDATERPIRRPQDRQRRLDCYSGKRRRHTIKNTLLTDVQGRRILYVGTTAPGTTHDKTLLQEDDPPFPPDSHALADLGYAGYRHPTLCLSLPPPKPKGQPFPPETLAARADHHRHRARVEHAIGRMKVHRIVSDIYRNLTKGMDDQVLIVAAGLVNLKASRPYRSIQPLN